MGVQAGAGRMGSPGRAGGAVRFDSIRQSGDQALAEMTRLVALLQSDGDEDEPEHDRLRLLLDQAQVTGLDVHSTPLPADVRLPAEIDDCAYRLVQEGLTNASASSSARPDHEMNRRSAGRTADQGLLVPSRRGRAPRSDRLVQLPASVRLALGSARLASPPRYSSIIPVPSSSLCRYHA